MANTNIIEFKARNSKNKSKDSKKAKGQSAEVVDIVGRREEMIQNERRITKRTILSEFIGAYAVIPGKGLIKVSMYDISDDGLSFDTESSQGHFHLGEEIAMRVYLNQKSYFPFVVRLQNLREVSEDGVYRHGVNFVKETVNEEALHHFVKFIESVSTSLESDEGDLKASIS
ncbi:MAG TPA: PilZ domain-containing protein [Bdellovibrionales bacterium]|nr:PilZ domain-containing protein [Thioclava sp.]HAG91975.1 PilZ domain-containing protein [Bdellovibrionales bacterium]|tara:strand:- start:3646 stop:4161 length:516 start_codon:yes stop_codon:yes gene_type:complete